MSENNAGEATSDLVSQLRLCLSSLRPIPDDVRAIAGHAADEIERLRTVLSLFYYGMPCPACSGDCATANPPVAVCPMLIARDALNSSKAIGGTP